jgi:uncharacterized membrane protein
VQTRKELSLKGYAVILAVSLAHQFVGFYALSFDDVSVIAPLLSIEPVFVAFCFCICIMFPLNWL